MRRSLRIVVAVLVAVSAMTVGVAAMTSTDTGEGANTGGRFHAQRPIIFVHGSTGSGAQFETQALRFTSNGYRPELIALHEYDSLFTVETRAQIYARLDQRIDQLLRMSHADKVDLLGHSLGTALMQEYLSTPSRAAKVAHYVNLDGSPAAAPPGGVPTLAIWGEGSPARRIVGASNVYFTAQSHVQVVTSEETFRQIYAFFTGREPATTKVLPENGPRIRLAGRAQFFPQNTGVTDATLKIYEINGATGQRLDNIPEATFPLTGDGAWGPFGARTHSDYEFAIVSDTGTHHLYYEPFVRSDYWIRLLTSEPDAGLGALIERGPNHASLTIVRYKEQWGDQGAGSDVLEVNGVNVLNAATSPRAKRVNAVFVYDRGSDRASDLTTPIPGISSLPFLTAVDMYLPAANPATGTISIASTPRLGGGKVEVINVPNWPSSTDPISVQFHEYTD